LFSQGFGFFSVHTKKLQSRTFGRVFLTILSKNGFDSFAWSTPIGIKVNNETLVLRVTNDIYILIQAGDFDGFFLVIDLGLRGGLSALVRLGNGWLRERGRLLVLEAS
jgi:hypothetical protein